MKKALVSLFFLIGFTQIFAHSFHYEVQVNTKLIVSKQLQLTALEITLQYDETVSLAFLEDQKDLKKLGQKLITDLDTLGYFTQIKQSGRVLEITKAQNTNLKKGKRSALSLHFTLPLKTPASLKGNNTLSLDHEDPTSAAILYYDNVSNIQLSDILKKQCKASIEEKGDFAEGEFPQIVKIACTIPE